MSFSILLLAIFFFFGNAFYVSEVGGLIGELMAANISDIRHVTKIQDGGHSFGGKLPSAA